MLLIIRAFIAFLTLSIFKYLIFHKNIENSGKSENSPLSIVLISLLCLEILLIIQISPNCDIFSDINDNEIFVFSPLLDDINIEISLILVKLFIIPSRSIESFELCIAERILPEF